MSVNPYGHIETTIEYNGKKLKLMWDGYSLYVESEFYSTARISSLNEKLMLNTPGNITVEFGQL